MELQQTSQKICASAVRLAVAVCVDVHVHVAQMAGIVNYNF
jgi:hypothetical protein